jgi:hypothetical protein
VLLARLIARNNDAISNNRPHKSHFQSRDLEGHLTGQHLENRTCDGKLVVETGNGRGSAPAGRLRIYKVRSRGPVHVIVAIVAGARAHATKEINFGVAEGIRERERDAECETGTQFWPRLRVGSSRDL